MPKRQSLHMTRLALPECDCGTSEAEGHDDDCLGRHTGISHAAPALVRVNSFVRPAADIQEAMLAGAVLADAVRFQFGGR